MTIEKYSRELGRNSATEAIDSKEYDIMDFATITDSFKLLKHHGGGVNGFYNLLAVDCNKEIGCDLIERFVIDEIKEIIDGTGKGDKFDDLDIDAFALGFMEKIAEWWRSADLEHRAMVAREIKSDSVMRKTVKDYIKGDYDVRRLLLTDSLIDGQGMINYGQNNEEDARYRAMIMMDAIARIFQIYNLNSKENKENIEGLNYAIRCWYLTLGKNKGNVLTSKEAMELDLEKAINAAL